MKLVLNIPGLVYQRLLRWCAVDSRQYKSLTNDVVGVSQNTITVVCSKPDAEEILILAMQLGNTFRDQITVSTDGVKTGTSLH